MQCLHIQLLGNFGLMADNVPVTSINTPRLQALLVYLLLHHQSPQSRHHIAFQFWPDSSEKQAHTNLRKLLFQLRSTLPDPDHFLRQDHLTVQWRPDAPYTLDVTEVQALLTHCHKQPNAEALARIAHLYQGELLPGCYDEWLLPIRQQLQREVTGALEQLINLHEHQREYHTGIRYAQRLLGLDPLHENAYRRLMQLHALNGDRTAALHDYHTCVTILQQELGVEPDEETHTLYQRLLTMDGHLVQQSAPLVDAPLVGRVVEWRTLLAAWRGTQRGRAHFVSIAGEAGMGKTRLAEELLTWANAQGIRSARTRSYEAEGGLAYAPVTEWLRAGTLKPTLKKLDKVWVSEVARLLPELLTEHPHLPPPAPLTEGWQRQRFFEALTRAILVEKTALLLVIDDLQWCDLETLTWLRFLLRFDPQAQLLIVGTWRSEAVDEMHPLQTLLRDLQSANQMTAIELMPLNAQETGQLAQQIGSRPIAALEIQQLYQVTEGHPLFVVETMRTNGAWQGTSGDTHPPSLPSKVQNVIQARLAQLSSQARELAGLAATVGRRFTWAVLAQASQLSEVDLVQTLDELWQRRIIREQGGDTYDFAHDRIREVAYQALSQVRRKFLHQRVAEALEVIDRAKLDEISSQLATHYEQGGNPDKARTYFLRAGERALHQFVSHDALHYFQRALALTSPSDSEERIRLLLQCEEIYEIQGQSAERYQNLLALQQLTATNLDGPSQSLAYSAAASTALAQYYRQIGNYEDAIRLAQDAITRAQASNVVSQKSFVPHPQEQGPEGTPNKTFLDTYTDVVTAKALYVLGYAYWGQGKMADARLPLEQSVQIAHSISLNALEAQALEQLAATEMFSGGDAALILEYNQRCMTIYQQRGDLYGQVGIYNKLGFLPFAQGEGDYNEAVGYYERGIMLSRQIGAQRLETMLTSNLGYLYTFVGDYAQAVTWQAISLRLARETKDRMREAAILTYMGECAFQQSSYAEATTHQKAGLAIAEQIGSEQWRGRALYGLGRLCSVQGQYEQAIAFSQAAVSSAQTMSDSRVIANALVGLGHALTGLGHWNEAHSFYQEAYALRQHLKQYNRSLEPLAGLALIALHQQELVQASTFVEQILVHLQTNQLDRTDEALHVYMSCYQVLSAMQDARAADLLHRAYQQLQNRAATLPDDEARRLFWSSSTHCEVLRLVQDNG